MDALVAAAKKEGTLNVIALPPDWANYGEVIKAFQAKYGLKVDSAQPDASSADEITAAKNLKGQSKAPDVFDLSAAVATANTSMFAPYQSAKFGEVPAKLKDAERHLGQRLRRLHEHRLRRQAAGGRPPSPTCSSRSSRARWPSTATPPRPAQASAGS